MILLNQYLVLAAALFVLGLMGVIIRRNALVLLMSIELMLNAVNLSFVAFSRYQANLEGQVAAFFVVVLAAAEAAIGLAMIVLLFRRKASVQSGEFKELKDATHAD